MTTLRTRATSLCSYTGTVVNLHTWRDSFVYVRSTILSLSTCRVLLAPEADTTLAGNTAPKKTGQCIGWTQDGAQNATAGMCRLHCWQAPTTYLNANVFCDPTSQKCFFSNRHTHQSTHPRCSIYSPIHQEDAAANPLPLLGASGKELASAPV